MLWCDPFIIAERTEKTLFKYQQFSVRSLRFTAEAQNPSEAEMLKLYLFTGQKASDAVNRNTVISDQESVFCPSLGLCAKWPLKWLNTES